MSYTYSATKKDLVLIEASINIVFDSRLTFIFKQRKAIEKFLLISYDSSAIYCFTTEKMTESIGKRLEIKNKKDIFLYTIPYKLYITAQDRIGWHNSILLGQLYKILPKNIMNNVFIPKISGSLPGDFVVAQRELRRDDNPYISKESFIATIIHEFGHAYYAQASPSIKEREVRLFTDAEKVLIGKNSRDIKIPYMPYISSAHLFDLFGEVYAISSELYASTLLFPKHKEMLSLFFLKRIQQLMKDSEENKNYSSIVEKEYHTTAAAISSIFMQMSPKSWPEIIINYPYGF